MVSFTHEQSITCSQTQMDDIIHWQTFACWSHGGLLANETEEKFASNDTNFIIIQRCAAAPYLSSVFRNLSKNGN